MSTPITIVHAPHGAGSPYFTGMEERIPRDPVAGDMVSVGFLTGPGQITTSVILYWTRNGRPQTPILGRPVARHQDFDRWLVELGVVEAGDEVEYWIEATSAAGTVASSHFQFTARRWRRAAAFVAVPARDGQVNLVALDADNQPGPAVRLRQLTGQSVLQLQVQQGAHSPATTLPQVEPIQAGQVAIEVALATGRLALRAHDVQLHLPLTLRWLEEGDGTLVAVELTAPLADDEHVVGFGERFDTLDQRGRLLDAVVYEQYKNQGNRTYLPVPFFMSSTGYGCLVEGTGRVTYDMGHTVPDRWRFVAWTSSEQGLAIDFISGTPAVMVQTLTALAGRPEYVPPAWVFGPWMSSNEWNTQARVEHEVAQTVSHGIPATVLVIEAWSDETTFYIWNGARYTARPGAETFRLADFTFPADGPWPAPKAMVDALHAMGIRLVLWQIPALKHMEDHHAQHEADVEHALVQNFVIRRRDGTPYRNPAFWFNQAMIPDFTSQAATEWWLNKRAYLVDEVGIDGFKTDGGEHLQGDDLCTAGGCCGNDLVNAYPNLYTGAYHRFVTQRRHGDGITFSRAGYTGASAWPAHWAGDENSTWEAFQRSIVAGLSAAASGVLFWGWDIAGFSEALPGAELYLRATAMAAFCPIMQFHSEYRAPGAPSKDRTPWHIQEQTGDERVIPLYRFYARVRMNLLPYLVNEAAYTTASGEPMMRPLLLDAHANPQAWRIQDQYCLGRSLLVAPVVTEGANTRRLYLPAGEWYDLWQGRLVAGEDWIEVYAPLERLPVHVRAGTILPLNLGAGGELGVDVGNSTTAEVLTLRVFPNPHAAGAESVRLVLAGGNSYDIAVKWEEDGVEIAVPALPVPIRLDLADGQLVGEGKAGEPHRFRITR
ncbi:MAG: hypothetical protein H3C34_04715 [Caldilineaceae bacterium]|nr:hypothetical protein [Caldilineaceae bacterium]